MKQGSADDPFAEESTAEESDVTPAEPTAETSTEEQTDDTASDVDDTADEQNHALPWLYRRENARDGRGKTKQLHLQQTTAQRESAFKSDVESELGQSVQLTDLREAALLVAMDHVDEVGDQLREWGYDFD